MGGGQTSDLHGSTPFIFIAVPFRPVGLEETKTPQYTSHLYCSTSTMCTALRTLFVQQCFEKVLVVGVCRKCLALDQLRQQREIEFPQGAKYTKSWGGGVKFYTPHPPTPWKHPSRRGGCIKEGAAYRVLAAGGASKYTPPPLLKNAFWPNKGEGGWCT